MMSSLFLVSPIGRNGSDGRSQADAVAKFVRDAVGPSCVVTRGDEQPHARIADSILAALQRYPIVVAYLGSEKNGGWNPNVMFEVGYRMATSKPMVLLAHEGESVPFDLKDFRHVAIAPVDKLPYGRNMSSDDYDAQKQLLVDAIEEQSRHHSLMSPFAIADFFIDTTERRSRQERESNSIFLRASEKADRLFHTAQFFRDKTLVGKQLTEVDRRLETLIEKDQLKEFRQEQRNLLGGLLLGEPNIEATVPFIFRESLDVAPEFQRRAFLPLITDYEFKENGLAVRVLYQEVPNSLAEPTKDGVFRVTAADSRDFLNKYRAGSA